MKNRTSTRTKCPNLLTAFDALLGPPVVDDIPEGFFTVEQIAKHRRASVKTTGDKLLELSRENKITRIQGRNENGRVCWFYGVKHRR
jgi:predicted Rossmann fold nucleotide-binding protein DprA/Smf involved in DNA uptake